MDCDSKCSQCNTPSGVGCTKKGTDNACTGNKVCSSTGVCACGNGVQDNGESDVDCGGGCLPDVKCGNDKKCGASGDANCTLGNCCSCCGANVCKGAAACGNYGFGGTCSSC